MKSYSGRTIPTPYKPVKRLQKLPTKMPVFVRVEFPDGTWTHEQFDDVVTAGKWAEKEKLKEGIADAVLVPM